MSRHKTDPIVMERVRQVIYDTGLSNKELSEANGLKYLVDDDRQGVIISGMRGKTGLDIRQAKALCRELPGILEEMGVAL